MKIDKDYYVLFGVLPSIEATALQAVYRALLKKYHPDVYAGNKSDSERITKALNEAYAVLENSRRRAEYDSSRSHLHQQRNDYDPESERDNVRGRDVDDALRRDWEYVTKYYPEAERCRAELSSLSSALALSFQITLVEAKTASKALPLRDALKRQFLERHFGENEEIHAFVLYQPPEVMTR